MVNTSGDYAWTFIVCVVMGFGRQLFGTLRHEVVAANLPGKAKLSSDGSSGLLDDISGSQKVANLWLRPYLSSAFLRQSPFALRSLDLLLFGASLVMSYLNMLVVMTYNPGLLMAMVMGEMAGIGVLQPIGGFQLLSAERQDVEEEACCH